MSRKPITNVLITLTLVGLTAAAVAQTADNPKAPEDSAASKLPACPVMGEPVDFNIFTMADDGPVYFCCKSCVKKYQNAPGEFADKVAEQRALLKKLPRVQVVCPISGKPIDKSVFTEQSGEKVYFCCADCKAKFADDPAAYHAKLEASYTYQTKCPVMGGDIDPASYSDLPTGERVYFCCKGCDSKLRSDPEKYAPKLAAQGINIDVAKLKSASEKPVKP